MANDPQSSRSARLRRLPVGAEAQPDGGTHFRVWAPAAREVATELTSGALRPLEPEADSYFSGYVVEAEPGARYRYRLDGERALPDPASRFQPDGPHGASEVIDPAAFTWTDGAWRGVPRERLVIYEMHVGTFTPEGSWAAAARHLRALAELGITCVEMMPVADFSGRFGWGYDGVALFAPSRLYGRPDDLRSFVDRAHSLGIAVILDVVYNHLGPDGNYLAAFAPAYFTDRYANEWGEAPNFDGPDSGPVRQFFIANAGYWIDEYHFDGLRLDATQQIFDRSADHVLAAIVRRVRDAAGARRITFVSAENERQEARAVRSPGQGGYGLDAIWNDDFHHSAMVALTGRADAYYGDYSGRPAEFVAAARHGFLYQGQRSAWQRQPRGAPALDIGGRQFVAYLQNHDQIANSGAGLRGHRLADPGSWRAMVAHLLLGPAIPLLFQGEEFAASGPFLFFADYGGELGGLVKKGRHAFLSQFPSLASPEMQATLADPAAADTFRRCVLDWEERERNQALLVLYRDLLALRHNDPAFGGEFRLEAGVLGDQAWLLRYIGGIGEALDRLLVVNLGRDLVLETTPEPLLAPVDGSGWRLLWSSEATEYGGIGTTEPCSSGVWRIPGHAAIVLAPGDPAL